MKDKDRDLTMEIWREYDFQGRVYRIDFPAFLHCGETTHHVTDADGIVHYVPTVGRFGCVLRVMNKPKPPKVREDERK